ncbi:2-hydroxyacylsphingosine 1-beta-galactosyltransferase [Engraulis encrasicolus]|uniref:2-hydroxyacylsphingosine 1-beta-galactosyltransferase n=1 Tax=Engraulis encrasicolus TaxID=184585 RepID=UPI002FD19EC0
MKPLPAITSLLLLFFNWSWAAKIVVVPPIMFESHLYIFKTLATALHADGHDTVFLVSEGREVPESEHYRLQRYPGIFNSSTADDFLQSKVRNIFSGRLTALELFDILDHYSQNCDAVVGSEAVMAQLKQESFDLLLVDPNEMCGFVIAHILGVQYAVFSTGLWYPAEVGAPAPLSYVPEFNSLLTDRMTLLQRVVNTAVYLVSRFGVQYLVLPKYDRIMKKHNIEPAVSMHDLVQGSRLWMLCTDMALEFPRPTLPHVVYVGGILTKPPNPLPQEFDDWLKDTEKDGFMVVSFGAGVKYLSDDIAHKLAGALGRLQQKVIWRFSGVPPSNLGNNTKLVDWMPQNDLLDNQACSYSNTWNLDKTMHLEKYRERARMLSNIHKDQPGHPVSRAVYWINYILRHHGAPHLHSSVYNISTYQYFLLDVVVVMATALLLIGFCLYRIGRAMRARFGKGAGAEVFAKENGHCHNGVPNGKLKRNGHIKSNDKKLK